MPQINSQWIRTKQVQSQKFKYWILEQCRGTALSQIWENAKGQWESKESMRKWWWGRERQRQGTPVFTFPLILYISLFPLFIKLHTPVLYLNNNFLHWPLTQKFCVNWVKSVLIQLCDSVCQPWGTSVSYPHAATRLLASHFRGDTLPRSPFNTAPAASIDWFSPTVGAQLSLSQLRLLALCADYGKVRRREVYEKGRQHQEVSKRPLWDTTLMSGSARAITPQCGRWPVP